MMNNFPGGSDSKVSACNEGELGSIPGSGRSPGEGNGSPLQNSCLENPMDGGTWYDTGRETEKVELEKARDEALPQGSFCLAAFPGVLASTAPRVLAPIQRPWHA